VPLIVFALPVTLVVALIVIDAFELFDRFDNLAAVQMPLIMVTVISMELAILVVAVWFLFFSGLRWTTRLIGVGIVALVVGGLYAFPRHWEFSGRMVPMPVFRWEPDLQGEFDRRLANAPAGSATLSSADLAIAPDDFPRYRGTRGDGVAPAITLARDWSQTPPEEIWRTTVGWSYAGVAVAGKVAITLEQRKENEAVVCYDRAKGKELWAHTYPALFTQSKTMGGNGPRSTPTIADGDVYSLGALGDLVCLDGTTGKPRWAKNILDDNGAKKVQWGMTSSPLIVGDLVVVNAGVDPDDNKAQAVAAYHRKTGEKAWAAGSHGAGYSSPILATLANVEQIVLFDGDGVAGIDPKDGKEFWRHPWKTFQDMNIIQPLILPGDRVFISSQPDNGGAVLQIVQSASGWSADVVWSNRKMSSIFANPVYHDGHIYGLSDGILCCVDAKTGARKWREESAGSGQLILTGSTLIVQTETSGEIFAVAADPAEYRELGRHKVFRGKRTWNTPALAGGRLYVRNHEEMVCLEVK
jgi:outer membrane protein assembly factor BamB